MTGNNQNRKHSKTSHQNMMTAMNQNAALANKLPPSIIVV